MVIIEIPREFSSFGKAALKHWVVSNAVERREIIRKGEYLR